MTLSGSLAAASRIAAAMPNTPKSIDSATALFWHSSGSRTGSPLFGSPQGEALVEVRRDRMDELEGAHFDGHGLGACHMWRR